MPANRIAGAAIKLLAEGEDSLYQSLLHDSRFFDLLLRLDEDLAEEARRAGCACGGVLHSAYYFGAASLMGLIRKYGNMGP